MTRDPIFLVELKIKTWDLDVKRRCVDGDNMGQSSVANRFNRFNRFRGIICLDRANLMMETDGNGRMLNDAQRMRLRVMTGSHVDGGAVKAVVLRMSVLV